MSTLPTLLQQFTGYDLNGDGIKEIEELKFLPFERETDALDPSSPLLLVLVEARLLNAIPGSAQTSDDLLTRLRRFKTDLEADGYRVRGVQAKVYAGPLHQDGRTLLALRAFLRAVRDSYAHLQGAILIGSFPDASIIRTWTQLDLTGKFSIDGHEFLDGTHRYHIGCGDHASRAEIVLADLDGRWETLYEQGPLDIETYTVVPDSEQRAIVPTPDGPRTRVTIRSSPGRYVKTLVHVADAFVIRDAQFHVVNADPHAFELWYITNAANPETSTADRAQANPLSRPDIAVSRINARNIAVNPDPAFRDIHGQSFLDAQGKPQMVETTVRLDLDRERFWKHDPALERRLLIDYLDRNHAYRRGTTRHQPFRFSIAEYQLSHGLQGTLAKLASDMVSPMLHPNATLLDYVGALKEPAFLKVLEAHSEPKYAAFGTAYSAADLESAAGGPPWRWKETRVGDRYRYTPSLAEQSDAADLHLHRTLWESGVLREAGGNLFIHTGCNVNTPEHSFAVDYRTSGPAPIQDVVPYSSPRYGVFQNGEGILFYLNGLALLSRAKYFFDAPRELGEAFGESEATPFGACWRRYFDVEARDVGLAQNETDRKRSSMWSMAGDWTLRKRYQPFLNHFFTAQSIYLATPPLGGYVSATRNRLDQGTHLGWARGQAASAVVKDLVEKVLLQFDRQLHPAGVRQPAGGAGFFADVALRLRSYGVSFAGTSAPNANSMDRSEHQVWALLRLSTPDPAGELMVRSELEMRVRQTCAYVLSNYRRMLDMLFTSESLYLARLGGYTHPNRNSIDPALHHAFAVSVPVERVRDDLIDKYQLQMDRLTAGPRARAYTDICVRLNSFGVDFGSISANWLEHGMHEDWALHQTAQSLKDQLVMRVQRLFEP